MRRFLLGLLAGALMAIAGIVPVLAASPTSYNYDTCSDGQSLMASSGQITCPGQVWGGYLAKSAAINMAATGDTLITLPSFIQKYQLTQVLITNCSATPILASVGMWTGPGATGTNVFASLTITGLTAPSLIVTPTLLQSTSWLTSSTLYVRVTVANAAALTCDVYVFGRNLT